MVSESVAGDAALETERRSANLNSLLKINSHLLLFSSGNCSLTCWNTEASGLTALIALMNSVFGSVLLSTLAFGVIFEEAIPCYLWYSLALLSFSRMDFTELTFFFSLSSLIWKGFWKRFPVKLNECSWNPRAATGAGWALFKSILCLEKVTSICGVKLVCLWKKS